jgi:D-sedoheptulose 7-phosphate isomerase
MAKERRDGGGVFFFVGNGASATMAEHLSHDCFQNADMLTYTCSETAHITAISNDISYERVFAYRITKMCRAKDVLVTISSSGDSPNILNAIEAAREKGMFVVTLSGRSSGNSSRKRGDLNFYVPLPTYGLVESAHSVLLHSWLDLFLDKYMGGRH